MGPPRQHFGRRCSWGLGRYPAASYGLHIARQEPGGGPTLVNDEAWRNAAGAFVNTPAGYLFFLIRNLSPKRESRRVQNLSQDFVNQAATKMIFRGDDEDYAVVLEGIRDGVVSMTQDEQGGFSLRATPARPHSEILWTHCVACLQEFDDDDLEVAECLPFDDGTIAGPWCSKHGPHTPRRVWIGSVAGRHGR